jgi:glutamate racemase
VACPLFVPFVEEGWLGGEVVLSVARKYLKPLRQAKVDTVILGCTHYPLLRPVIQEVLGKQVVLIDSAKQVAFEIKKILASEDLLNRNKAGTGKHKFYVSDNPEWFSSLAQRFMGRKLMNVRKVDNV